MQATNCPTCKHTVHVAGSCTRCNCGESELVHATASMRVHEHEYTGRSQSSMYGYNRGHQVPKRRQDQ